MPRKPRKHVPFTRGVANLLIAFALISAVYLGVFTYVFRVQTSCLIESNRDTNEKLIQYQKWQQEDTDLIVEFIRQIFEAPGEGSGRLYKYYHDLDTKVTENDELRAKNPLNNTEYDDCQE